jgi:hypothetical protein
MRFHHYLWHSARNGWLSYDAEEQEAYRRLGYEPPRPALDRDRKVDLANDSGEDFLYMHRRMIEHVNERLEALGDPAYPRVQGWAEIPQPDDPDYPVPARTPDGGEGDLKSDAFYSNRLARFEQRYRDPEFLSTVGVGELGARIEFTVHNWMHGRWSEPLTDARPDADPRNPSAIDSRWDDISYDWLGDFYSSHVHSTFWRLHGWVDDRIDDWARANGLTRPIEWKGTWEGPSHDPGHGPHRGIRPEDERAPTTPPRSGRDFGRPLLDVTVPD